MDYLKPSIIEGIFKFSNNRYDHFLNYFHSIHIPIIETKLKLAQTIFRARFSKPDEILEDYTEYIYPPHKSNSFSRIGKPGDTWFYASDNYEACLMEMLPYWYEQFELGTSIRVSIGTWQIRQVISILLIPDVELKNEIAKAFNEVAPYSEEDKKFWNFISPYFYQSSKCNPVIYELTSALVTSVLERSELTGSNLDGIAYPSIQYREKTNVALKPSVIDNEQLIFKSAFDMIFNKESELNEEGLPIYLGPFDGRQGILNQTSGNIDWI
ncbi:hypothetical protein AWW67_03165 [Roseivirga seohaensis]|uniref:RES domain-containing protein n=1 Tax=Roseivirga seohaensis TaxID=1914963 RepID=A0A150XZM3_9BACT|nr:hypothetical protein [Roseivirga seohaensis]KYG84126.1 hypothetical protein AWW67_03165 [Roseivirga seohaensis]